MANETGDTFVKATTRTVPPPGPKPSGPSASVGNTFSDWVRADREFKESMISVRKL